MSPRAVTGTCAVRNRGEAYTDWNYNTMGSDNKFVDVVCGKYRCMF
jgi:hypothetical protein